jgi:hypothetical protein
LATIWLTVTCLPTSRRKSEEAEPAGPLGVVDERRPAEPGQLLGDAREVAGEGVGVEQVPLVGAPARVADHPRRTTGQGDRVVAGVAEAPEHQDADEVADVEAVGGGVAPPVQGEGPGGEAIGERRRVGRVVHEAPCDEVGEHIHAGHRGPTTLPGPTGCRRRHRSTAALERRHAPVRRPVGR